MMLNCKSSSSIQEASVGNGDGKAGLKRKLTGPPRLLLGKSKAKSGLETRKDTARMFTEGHSSYGKHRSIMVTQQSTVREEMSAGCISDNREKPVESEVKQTTPENQFETERTEEKAGHSDIRNDPKKLSLKRVCKRIFPSSLNCIRRKRLHKISEMEDVTFHNTQSAKVECDNKLAMSDTLPPERHNAQTNSHQGCRTVKRGTPFSAGIRWNITKLLKAPRHHKKTKRQSEKETDYVYVDSLGPDLYLRKRIGHFLKHGLKKPDPFFHEQLERDYEYLDEETIVLCNSHAGDPCQNTHPDIQEGTHSDGDTEASAPQSEILTVSVEVSVIGEGDRKERETNSDLEASGNLITASGQREKEDPQWLAEASDENGGTADTTESSRHPELVMTDFLVKETPRKNLAVQGASGSRLSTADTREGQEDVSEGQEDTRLPGDDAWMSSCELFKETVVRDEKVLGETIPQSKVPDEDCVQHNLALKNAKLDGLHLCYDDTNRGVENGPEVLSEENLWTKDNSYKHSLHVKGVGSQCGDVLLVQTACSLVQAAMKAALDQLAKELKNKSVSIPAEYHEFQDNT